jgi:hypothetical protein
MHRGVLCRRRGVEDVLGGASEGVVRMCIVEGCHTVVGGGRCSRGLEVRVCPVNGGSGDWQERRHTSPRLGRLLPRDAGLFEGPPFEVLLVAAARHGALCTLPARRLRLVALEALVLAGDAAWRGQYQVPMHCVVDAVAYAVDSNNVVLGRVHAPLRLLLCFRLATPVVSAAFGACLGTGGGGRAILGTWVGSFGPGSGDLKANEGGERVTVSAMCRDGGLRYVGAPAWRDSAACRGSGLMAGRARQSLKLCDGCGERVLSKVESSWGCGGLTDLAQRYQPATRRRREAMHRLVRVGCCSRIARTAGPAHIYVISSAPWGAS